MASVVEPNDPSGLGDRRDIARQLVQRLGDIGALNPIVVGVAPDGMPIAAEIADRLRAPLDTVAVAPVEIGGAQLDRVGTTADGGVAFFDDARAQVIDAQPEAVDAALIRTQQRLERRGAAWHRLSRRPSLRGRAVVLVGEGLEDEEIAAAACAIRDRGAAKVIYAAPRLRLAVAIAVGDWVDQFVCLETVAATPSSGRSAGAQPVSDDEVRSLLRENDIAQHPSETHAPH
jgi:predicted phosphoribosyltransferase